MQVDLEGGCRLELVEGDITRAEVDAIVNAANSHLVVGGGVDGAIHRRGGPDINAETRRRYPQGCPTGSAVISGAGRLPARYVIHAVGPRWHGGTAGEAQQLVGAHRAALELAVEHGAKSIAFPAISTGIYGYPLREASRIALTTALDFVRAKQQPALVRFVLFSPEAYAAFAAALRALTASES